MLQAQDDRLLAVATTLGKDAFLAVGISGEEALSQLFSFEIELVSENLAVDPKALLGTDVTLSINMRDNITVPFNGIVSHFATGALSGHGTRHYHMRLVPWLWFLTQRVDIRIFQQQSVLDIVKAIFADMGMTGFSVETTRSYPKYDYKVQYRESDFNFVSRLLEHAGIYYFFRHENGKHTMVLADYPTAMRPCAEGEPTWSGERKWQHIHAWQHGWEYRSGRWTLNDFNFEKPKQDLTSSSATLLDLRDIKSLEVYEYPGSYTEKEDGAALSRLRIESEEAAHHVISGASMVPSFHAGTTFKVGKHELAAENGKNMALVWVRHSAFDENTGYGEGGSSDYTNQFRAMPAETPFRPVPMTRRPVVHGPQTAIVVGPAGEEIYTDKYGRVKIQLHWDREGKYNEKSSCWVRVAQSWAGKQWGYHAIPRVGMEVIVTFLEGDPDRPLITGTLYNAEAMPPDALPDHRTRTVFRTRSSPKGSGYNEFSFEDKKGQEQVFLRAERDWEQRVGHDAHQTVGKDWHQVVKGKAFEKITGDQSITLLADRMEKITGTHSIQIGSDHHLKVGEKLAIKAGSDIMIETMPPASLTLKAGGNFIKLDASGITLVGTMLNLNSGGSPGSLSADPKPPLPADEADDRTPGQALGQLSPKDRKPAPMQQAPVPLQTVQASALTAASQAGTPFCPLCAAASAIENALG